MTLESLSCPEVATSVARRKQNTRKISSLQDTNPLKNSGGGVQGNYRAENPSPSPQRLTVGLPPAARSRAADAWLLGAGKFALPGGAGLGCQSPGQYMVMGL